MKMRRVPPVLVAGIVTLLLSSDLSAQAQISAKVNYIEGEASIQSGGRGEWFKVKPGDQVNVADNFWANQNSRAELLVGNLVIGINSETSLTIESADDARIELKLWLGSMMVGFPGRPDQQIAVETPNLRFALNQPGEYRLDVNDAGDETIATVWSGEGESTGGGARYLIHASERAKLRGTDQVELEVEPAPSADDFDQWAFRRDQIVREASTGGPDGRDAGPPARPGDGHASTQPDDSGGRGRQGTIPIRCSTPWCELDVYPYGLNVWWPGLRCDPIACGVVIVSDVASSPRGPGLPPPLVPREEMPRPPQEPQADRPQAAPVALGAVDARDESRFSQNTDSGGHPTAGAAVPCHPEPDSNTLVAKPPGEGPRPASGDTMRPSHPEGKPSADRPSQPKIGSSRPNNGSIPNR